jgi:hypothetical protein
MRFIVGLLAGAFATLMVASTLNVADDDVFQRAQEHWRKVSRHFAAQNEYRGSDPSVSHSQSAGAPPQTLYDDTPVPTPEPSLSGSPPAASSIAEQQDTARADALPQYEEPPLEVSTPDHTGEATVWSPFHSEASASGFANRLTRQLAHPFQVRKLGPAEYVVVYTYADANEHHALQQRIAAVTGASST